MGSQALAFKEWATAEGIATVTPAEHFKNRRIAIDADDYLNTLFSTTGAYTPREPLLPALGGLPFELDKQANEDVQGFRNANIEPVFVFNGLDLACKDRASLVKESKKGAKVLDDAWTVYDRGHGDDSVAKFGQACTYRMYHVARALRVILHRLGVRVQTAPYSAAAQIVHMERSGFVDAILGSASCLVFGAEKVIINYDFSNEGRFFWVDLKSCLAKLHVNREQFVDVCLLAGASILPILPELDTDSPGSKIPAARSSMSRSGMDVSALLSKDEAYESIFQKARFSVKHPVVIKEDGKVEPEHPQSSPSDLHEVAGQRLPEEIYHYLAFSVIGPRLLNWRTRMEILEAPPLDGGSSQLYKDLVQERLRPLRAQALAIMTKWLHRYYQKNDVNLICWFAENDKRALNLPDNLEPAKAADSWNVKTDLIVPLNSGFYIDATPLSYAIMMVSNDATAKKTVTTRQPGSTLRLPQELLANTLWRFLTDRGYLNADHTLSSWGKVLKAAFGHAQTEKILSAEMEEIVIMAVELLRLDVLNTSQMFQFPPYSGAPTRGSDVAKAHTTLISRIACLGTFTHNDIGYTGPLSRYLLAYQQVAASVRGALRDLVEMHACNMFLSGAVDRDLEASEYADLGAKLPFVMEPNLGLGLVVKCYLDELSTDAGRRQDVVRWFIHAQDIPRDLQKAWAIWGVINAGVQAGDEKTVTTDTKKMFKDADGWLKELLKTNESPNGTA